MLIDYLLHKMSACDSRTRPFHSLHSRVYLSPGLAKSWTLADVLYCMVYGVTGRPVERWRSVSETQGQGGGAVPSQGASAVPWSHSTLPSTAQTSATSTLSHAV